MTEGDHRFFLALLLNVPSRAKVLEFVKQRHPERDPVDQVVEWVEDLTNKQIMGSSEANVLGLPDVDEDYLLILENLLQGQSLEQIKTAFAEDFSPEYAAQHDERIERLYANIRDSLLFRAIFQEKPASSV
ncbi:hypothetical protein C2W62_37575 [Candidatus Entotheonella serta]|nr:hypothetical protein C2W62_37575 [Candidatus Entotheonella serta]